MPLPTRFRAEVRQEKFGASTKLPRHYTKAFAATTIEKVGRKRYSSFMLARSLREYPRCWADPTRPFWTHDREGFGIKIGRGR